MAAAIWQDRYDFIKGVVGWVNLCSDDLDLQLEKYSAISKNFQVCVMWFRMSLMKISC